MDVLTTSALQSNVSVLVNDRQLWLYACVYRQFLSNN